MVSTSRVTRQAQKYAVVGLAIVSRNVDGRRRYLRKMNRRRHQVDLSKEKVNIGFSVIKKNQAWKNQMQRFDELTDEKDFEEKA